MKSYLGCIHASAPGLLAIAEGHAGPIYKAELADDHQRGISAAIFHALTMCMRGSPSLILRQCEFGCGCEAWRQLFDRYASASRGRQYALLHNILRPDPFGAGLREFEMGLGLWELLIKD